MPACHGVPTDQAHTRSPTYSLHAVPRPLSLPGLAQRLGCQGTTGAAAHGVAWCYCLPTPFYYLLAIGRRLGLAQARWS